MEVEHDFGAANGEATFIRFLPLWSLPLGEDWRLINLDLITVAEAPGGVPGRPGNPNPTLGERAFGLSDLLHTSFLTPEGQASKGGRPSCSCGLREYGVPYDSVHKPRHTKEAKR
jgi:hypothetical protein